jgi:general nucleoside transport system permease protein
MSAALNLKAFNKGWRRALVMALGPILLLAIAAQLFDTPGLTGSGTFGTAIGLAVPVVLAGLGALLSERAGVVNIGLEGMMVMGTWSAGFFGWHFGPWGALLGGLLGGLVASALHALATLTFGVNHTVSGVAINTIAPGVARYLSSVLFVGHADGSISDSPSVRNFSRMSLPFISGGSFGSWRSPDPLQWLENKQWFLISDIAGLLKGLTGNLAWSTVMLLALVPVVWYFVWRTPFGLRLRSAGEKPSAADSLGVNVLRVQWIAVLLSGALAGLGGSWLVLDVGKYQQGQTGLRGFLGIAAVIFGNWMPIGVMAGALLFSFSQSVTFQIANEPRGLIGAIGIALGLLAVWSATRKARNEMIVLGVLCIGVLAFAWQNVNINEKLVFTLPYLLTLLVLAFSSERLRPPAASGIVWRKGQG